MEILKNKNNEYIIENDYIDNQKSFDQRNQKIKEKISVLV